MLSKGRNASANAKKLTWMYLNVIMYNTLELYQTFPYIYRTFCTLLYI